LYFVVLLVYNVPLIGESKMSGMKHDDNKLQWSLLPWRELQEVVEVLMHGAEKYGPNNWQELDNAKQRYTDALMRHMADYMKGYSYDLDSGKHHMAHIACNALFLLWLERNGK
jgi:hypothetical protein